MGNLYLKKLRQKQPVINYGMEEDLLGDIYGVDLVQQPTKMDETATDPKEWAVEGLKKAGTAFGLVAAGVATLLIAPNLYRWIKGERVFKPKQQRNPMASFNMQHQMGDLEQKIVQLLQQSKDAYDGGSKNVDHIVEPFAQAQEMIHTDAFKYNYETDPVKLQIVEDFTRLGTQLSE